MFLIRCNSRDKSWRNLKKYPLRITKIKHFINKYNWKGINFSSEKDDWKKIKNIYIYIYITIALNVLNVKKNIYILLLFQNINLKSWKISYFFKEEKNVKLSPKDYYGVILH